MAVPVQASLTTSLAGADNDVKFISRWDATKGNGTSVAFRDPEGITHAAAISVDRENRHISVILRRAGNIIAMTANELIAAIRANADASDLVHVELASGNNGSGVLVALSRTSLSGGVDSAFANQAEAEQFYRTIIWDTGTNTFLSERLFRGAQHRIRTLVSAAVHRAALDKHYNDLARRGVILYTN